MASKHLILIVPEEGDIFEVMHDVAKAVDELTKTGDKLILMTQEGPKEQIEQPIENIKIKIDFECFADAMVLEDDNVDMPSIIRNHRPMYNQLQGHCLADKPP